MRCIKNFLSNENVVKGFKTVKNVATEGFKLVGPIAGVVLLSKVTGRSVCEKTYIGIVGYDDAVKAILHSSMWSDGKATVVSALKRDESSEFYSAIIDIVNSSMFSDDKVKLILSMNEE